MCPFGLTHKHLLEIQTMGDINKQVSSDESDDAQSWH